MEDELLTPEAAAEFLQMHVDSVRRLLRSRKLPGVKVGGGWRIPRASLRAMLSGQPAPPAPAIKSAPAAKPTKRKPAMEGKP